jgi:hypothetical protein
MRNRGRLETAALFGLTSCLLAVPLACGTQSLEANQDAGPPDTSKNHDTDALDASPDLVVSSAVWTDQSRAIDVTCGGFYQGSKRIRATRDQLSAEQLDLLSALTLSTPEQQCILDGLSCGVAVTAADGRVATYISDESGACGQTRPKIPLRTLSLFLATVPCLFGNQTFTTTLDGGVIPISVAPDARCFNGVATSHQPTTRFIEVVDPSIPRHLELDACNDQTHSPSQVHPQLLGPDGQTALSAGMTVTDPGLDQTCWRLDYTFTTAGTYQLRISLDPGFLNDIYLRFY